MIVIKDYWSPGKIIDIYGEALTEKDRKYIENINTTSFGGSSTDEMANWDERRGWVYVGDKDDNLKKQVLQELSVKFYADDDLKESVKSFYKTNFWDTANLDNILV